MPIPQVKKGKWSKERERTKSGRWRKKRSDADQPRRKNSSLKYVLTAVGMIIIGLIFIFIVYFFFPQLLPLP